MLAQLITMLFLVIMDSQANNAPIYVNGKFTGERIPTLNGDKKIAEESVACDRAKVTIGITTWLPPTSVKCELVINSSNGSSKCELKILKWINVFEEKQIHGSEKVLEHRKISLERSHKQGERTMVKGFTIWNELGLTDSDVLRTNKDPNKGKEITFNSNDEFAVETLDSLYIMRKETVMEGEEQIQAKTEAKQGEKLVPEAKHGAVKKGT